MNYEFNDYRKEPELHDPGPWLTWAVPESLVWRYFFRMAIFLYVVPTMLFGVQLSSLGYFLQFLIIDLITWMQYRTNNTI